MLEKEDTILNEFNHKMYDSNIRSFINHHQIHKNHSQEILISNFLTNTIDDPKLLRSKEGEAQIPKSQKAILRQLNKSRSFITDTSIKAPNIYALQYIDQNLLKLPPEANKQRLILNILDLSVNKLEYFPLEVIFFENLKVLKLDHNKIKSIPNEFRNLRNLEILSVAHNLIQFLPQTLPRLSEKLIELNIEGNVIENFGNEITDLANLQILNMMQNRFVSFSCSFKDLKKLKELYFEWFKYANPPMSVRQRKEETLQRLRQLCVEFDQKGKKQLNFVEFLDYLSENKVNIHSIDSYNRNIIYTAALNEDISVLKYILTNSNKNIDIIDKDNHTAFSASIYREKFASIRYLLKYGANPTKGGGQYSSPLHLAVRKMNYYAVREIMRYGENLNRQDQDGQTPLHHCISLMANGNQRAGKICGFLLENGTNPNFKNKERWAPIHVAARKKDPKTISWIISYNRECIEVHGREEIFKLGIKGGQYNWTAMHIAAYSECPSVLELLGEVNSDIFKRSLHGYTPKRLITKKCLTLKIAEKYEKKWLNLNVINKIKIDNENLIDHNLNSLNKSKEIGNASKNRFDNSYLYIDNNDTSCIVITKTKFDRTTANNNNFILKKPYDDPDDDVVPEMDMMTFGNFNEDDEDSNTTRLDFCSDLNENINVEANINNRNMAVPDKSIGFKIHNRNKSSFDLQSFVNFDLYSYENHFKKISNLTIEFLENEIKRFRESITLEKMAFSEKILVLHIMRRIHQFTISFLIKSYYDNSSIQNFAIALHQETLNKTRQRAHLTKISNYFDQVPRNLMGMFANMNIQSYDVYLLKTEICKILADFHYFGAINFLESILHNPSEHLIVKTEAQQSYSFLKEVLQSIKKIEPKSQQQIKILDKKRENEKSAKKLMMKVVSVQLMAKNK